MGQGLCLGPAQKGRGSTSKGGPLECGVPEFGSKSLGEVVWVGFRPSAVGGVSEGVSECKLRALGEGVGVGLGLCMARGRFLGQRIGPGNPTGSPVPKWTEKAPAAFRSSVPPHCPATVSHRVSPVLLDP